MKLPALLILALSPAFCVPAIVQQKHCHTNGSAPATLACTFDNTPTVGNLIVATCSYYNFDGTVTASLSDNRGNSYNQDAIGNMGNNSPKLVASIYSAANINSTATFTVTCATSAGTYKNLAVYEVSGAASPARDQTGSKLEYTASQNVLTVTTAGATSQNDEIVIAAFACGSQAPTAGSGYTLLQHKDDTGNVVAFVDEYKVISSTGTQTASVSVSAAQFYAAAIATYKAATGGGSPSRRRGSPIIVN